MADAKKSVELVRSAAGAVCGPPPKLVTPEEYRKILGKLKNRCKRRTVNQYLLDLGYKRPGSVSQHKKVRALITAAFKDAQGVKNDVDKVVALREKLMADISTAVKEAGLKTPSWKTICQIGRQMKAPGWPNLGGAKSRAKAAKQKELTAEELRKQLIDFLVRARTDKEIKMKFGDKGMALLAVFAETPPPGRRLKEGRSDYQEKTSYLEQVVTARPVKLEKPIFEISHAKNDPDYLSVRFPQDLDFTKRAQDNRLRILPIDSVFYSDYLCDLERFKEYLGYIKSKEYVFAFLNGDIIGGHDYTKDEAASIRRAFAQLIAPVAHKILWAQSGPLERRMMKIDGVEPLRDVCEELGIHHTDRPVRADVYWKFPKKPIEFYALHGRSQARKDGSKANAIFDAVVNQNFPHFTVMGHLQEGMTITYTVRRLDPIGVTIKEHTSYGVVCPGFKKHEGSEAEKKGYPPPAMGTVACVIGADNHHEASS